MQITLEFIKFLGYLVFLYPIIGSIFWIIGSIIYSFTYHRKKKNIELKVKPMVSILIPCHNEEKVIDDTLKHLLNDLSYENYEVITIDDGSTDNTFELLKQWQEKNNKLKIIKVEKNQGKAHALTQGLLYSSGEFLLCIDADSFVVNDAIQTMLSYFNTKEEYLMTSNVGAVTANPIPRNRSTLLAKMQCIDYASIIGLIKRSQIMIGKIFTVSGVCVMYRKAAIIDCGYWDQTKITEDIAMSWEMQLNNWRLRYAHDVNCYMNVPTSVKELFKQRTRWAQGGIEVLFKHIKTVIKHPIDTNPLIILALNQIIAILWAIIWVLFGYLPFIFYFFFPSLMSGDVVSVFLNMEVYLCILFIVSLLQLALSLRIVKNYDKDVFKYFFFAGWYPLVYWLISPFTQIAAIPKAIKSQLKGGQGTWTSPKR
ncbi:MAG: glycosyltransferase [Bacilli bacterium]|jgi:biofilm PGA synthesis N-glycosyltransferase PgaC|nr:glycosyltransferase [Bacilli bacterium]